MANYNNLKNAIAAVIKDNNQQEITGDILQSSLLAMVDSLGKYATFAGIAQPNTVPNTPDQNIFYIATTPGVYNSLGGVEVKDTAYIICNITGSWKGYDTNLTIGQAVLTSPQELTPEQKTQAQKNIGLELVQELGDKEDTVISQKAVTNALETKDPNSFTPLPNTEIVTGKIISATTGEQIDVSSIGPDSLIYKYEVTPHTRYAVDCRVAPQENCAGIAYYDSNDSFISAGFFSILDKAQYFRKILIETPAEAKYIRITGYDFSNQNTLFPALYDYKVNSALYWLRQNITLLADNISNDGVYYVRNDIDSHSTRYRVASPRLLNVRQIYNPSIKVICEGYLYNIISYGADKQCISVGYFGESGKTTTLPAGTEWIKVVLKKEDDGQIPLQIVATIECFSETSILKESYNTNAGSFPLLRESNINFISQLEISNPLSCEGTSTDLQDNDKSVRFDIGLLKLPKTYTCDGKPTPLIMFCHGYTAHYNATSEKIAPTTTLDIDYLLSEGFAVMDTDGSVINRTKPHAGSDMGIECYVAAYKWVTERYNVEKEIYLAGHSMGGYTAILLAMLETRMPIKAVCPICPVMTPIFFYQYVPADRAAISAYYGFTGVEPTWGTSKTLTSEEKEYIYSNLDKLLPRAPLWQGLIGITTEAISSNGNNFAAVPTESEKNYYNSKQIIRRNIPMKIFQGNADTITLESWTKLMVKMLKNAGQKVDYRILEGATHVTTTSVGSNTVLTKTGETMTVPTTLLEMIRFFRRY